VSSRDSRLVVGVSFNGYTREFLELPLAARVLFSALAAPSSTLKDDWLAFSLIPGVQSLKLKETLIALMEAAEAEFVVLCVDDINKSLAPMNTLLELTRTMDTFQRPGDPTGMSRLSIS
jgi:hypothetical protein